MKSNRIAACAAVLLVVFLLVPSVSLELGGMRHVAVSVSVNADPPMFPPPIHP